MKNSPEGSLLTGPRPSQVIVYAGKHYGRVHRVLRREGRWLVCLHVGSGERVACHVCDTEEVSDSQSQMANSQGEAA